MSRLYSSGRGVSTQDGSKTYTDGTPITTNAAALYGAVFNINSAGYLTQYIPSNTPSTAINPLDGLPSSVKPLKSSLFGDLLSDKPDGNNLLMYAGIAAAGIGAMYFFGSGGKK